MVQLSSQGLVKCQMGTGGRSLPTSVTEQKPQSLLCRAKLGGTWGPDERSSK